MKALITAGGRATRLRPITHTLNKHLIPLANRPMIFYAIQNIADVGISDIGISVNPGEEEVQKICGDGSKWGVRLTYIEQKGGPLGIAHVVNNARDFLGNEPFIFYLGDNIILSGLQRFVDAFEMNDLNCVLALSRVSDPQRFGVPEIRDGRIIRVDEKPSQPKSEYAVTGIYVYDSSFFEAFGHIRPSARGEYEISDVHTWLIENGYRVGYEEITGWWKDTGKPEDLLQGNNLLLDGLSGQAFENDARIDADAIIEGVAVVGGGSHIGSGTILKGPVSIGKNCNIKNAVIGPYVSLSDHVTIDGAHIERSIVMEGTRITIPETICDSIFGRNVMAHPSENAPSGKRRYLLGDNAVVHL